MKTACASLLGPLMSAVPALPQCPTGCSLTGDLSGTLGSASTVTQISGTKTGSGLPSSCTQGTYINFVRTGGTGPPDSGPYWCIATNSWVPVVITDTSGNLNLGASSTATGSMTFFSTAGGQLTLSLPSTLTGMYSVLLPAITSGSSGTLLGSNSTNDLTQGRLKLPNSAAFAPASEADIGYDTTRQSYVAGAAGGTIQSFALNYFYLSSASLSTPDLLCATTTAMVGGKTCAAAATTETAFGTTYTIPPNLLRAGKNLRVTAGFTIYTGVPSSQSVYAFNLALKLEHSGSSSPSTIYASYSGGLPTSGMGIAPTAVLPDSLDRTSFEGTWDLVGLTNPPSINSYIFTSNTLPSLPGADAKSAYNRVPQPVGGTNGIDIVTAAQTLKFYLTYLGTAGCTTTCQGNGVQLRWLRVETVN